MASGKIIFFQIIMSFLTKLGKLFPICLFNLSKLIISKSVFNVWTYPFTDKSKNINKKCQEIVAVIRFYWFCSGLYVVSWIPILLVMLIDSTKVVPKRRWRDLCTTAPIKLGVCLFIICRLAWTIFKSLRIILFWK